MKREIAFLGGLGTLVLVGWFGLGFFDKKEIPRKIVRLPSIAVKEEPKNGEGPNPLENILGNKENALAQINEKSPKDPLLGEFPELNKEWTEKDLLEYKRFMVENAELFDSLGDLGVDTDLTDFKVPVEPLKGLFDPTLRETDEGLLKLLTQGNITDVVDALQSLEINPGTDYLQPLIDGDYSTAFLELIKAGEFKEAAAIGELLGIDFHNLDVISRAEIRLNDIHLLKKRHTPPDQEEFTTRLRERRINFLWDTYEKHPELQGTLENQLPNLNTKELGQIFWQIDKDDPFLPMYKERLNQVLDEEGTRSIANKSPSIFTDVNDILTKQNYISYARDHISSIINDRYFSQANVLTLDRFLRDLEESEYEECHTIAREIIPRFAILIEKVVRKERENERNKTEHIYEVLTKRRQLIPQLEENSLRIIVESYIADKRKHVDDTLKGNAPSPFSKDLVVHNKISIVEAYLVVGMRADAEVEVNSIYELPLEYFKIAHDESIPEIVDHVFPELAPEVHMRHTTAFKEWTESSND